MKRTPFSDEIRQAARKTGRSTYALAKAMGVGPPTLWRFLEGKNGMSLALLDRLAETLDLHVVVGRKEK
jgi:transcriptional regulator with XRE-family HTH domain